MASVDIGADSLSYTEHGAGEPVVLVHGSASDRRSWRRQEAAFAARHRTIAYSRRYHWPNRPIAAGVDYGMLQQVDDLKQLLRALAAEPAHLVGHSYGAFLCLLLAVQDPRLVRSLVLAEPPAVTLFVGSEPRPLELLKVLVTRPRTGAAIVKFAARGVVPARDAFRRGDVEAGLRIYGDAVFGRGGFDRLPEDRRAQVRDNLSNVEAELLGSGFAPLTPAEVRALEMPVLLVTGERSIGLFHRLVDRLQELLPRAARVTIPGASHMLHEDNAPAFNAAVEAFLAAHAGGRA